MEKELRDKWVAALRSGKYKQGKKAMFPGTDEFCCLGVLVDILDPLNGTRGHSMRNPAYDLVNVHILGQSYELQDMNDSKGKSFHEIATWIEENL